MNGKIMTDHSQYSKIFMVIFVCCSLTASMVHAKMTLTFEQWERRQQRIDQQLMQHQATQIQSTNVQILRDQRPSKVLSYSSRTTLPITQVRPQRLGEQVSININQATTQEIIAKLDGIGSKKAQAIIQYRQQYGDFKTVDELLKVKGIGEKTLAKNRDRIRLKP